MESAAVLIAAPGVGSDRGRTRTRGRGTALCCRRIRLKLKPRNDFDTRHLPMKWVRRCHMPCAARLPAR